MFCMLFVTLCHRTVVTPCDVFLATLLIESGQSSWRVNVVVCFGWLRWVGFSHHDNWRLFALYRLWSMIRKWSNSRLNPFDTNILASLRSILLLMVASRRFVVHFWTVWGIRPAIGPFTLRSTVRYSKKRYR